MEKLNKIVQFFKESPLQTKKKQDFELFSTVIDMMKKKEHLTKSGIHKIAKITSQMNEKVEPNYLKSSETTCQTPEKVKI